jgi:hypothetical protein
MGRAFSAATVNPTPVFAFGAFRSPFFVNGSFALALDGRGMRLAPLARSVPPTPPTLCDDVCDYRGSDIIIGGAILASALHP